MSDTQKDNWTISQRVLDAEHLAGTCKWRLTVACGHQFEWSDGRSPYPPPMARCHECEQAVRASAQRVI